MKRLRLRGEGVAWREIDGEIVALDAPTSTYLAANRTGALLWQALAKGATDEDLVSRLVETFGIDAETARADVERFLGELAARGLLEE
jgi:hypothetical protein